MSVDLRERERNIAEDMRDLAKFDALQLMMDTLVNVMQDEGGVDTAELARARQLADVIGRVAGALRQSVHRQHGEG